ncbi:hypothetical protein BY458DRAFT_433218 [Sporodiniella umbellata]|nr:hypothetical protein BY458DRAFT_433218 [Sporodiniella umbellata]
MLSDAKLLLTLILRLLNLTGSLEDRKEYGFHVPLNAVDQNQVVFVNMYHVACRILSYVSAFNWTTYFGLFKMRLLQLTKLPEEGLELTDIVMLECASLNAKRLSMVLTEMCNCTLNFKRTTQQWMAVALRKAIWNWIENYSTEFITLFREQKRLDGTPEILFDIFNSLADNTKKKASFWPTQTMLLVLCPDILSSVSTRQTKKVTFRELEYSFKFRQIIPDFENEVIEKLFDSRYQFASENNTIHSGFSIDKLSLVSDLGVVKAALTLSSDRNPLPWVPPVSSLHEPLCNRIRTLFLEYHQTREKNELTRRQTKLRKELKSPSDEHVELILDVLYLYKADPQLAISGYTTESFAENMTLIIAITKNVGDTNPFVRNAAGECLVQLHASHHILLWSPSSYLTETFWKVSSQVLLILSQQLLSGEPSKRLLDLVKRLLRLRNEFLQAHSISSIDLVERWQASVSLEVALFVLLCLPEFCTLSIECFSLLYQETLITDPEEYHTGAQNVSLYTELARHSIITGRRSQQRKIRDTLCKAQPSLSLPTAWEKVWKRWKQLTPNMIQDESEKKKAGWQEKLRSRQTQKIANEDQSTEWQNYSGFLASLGGVCWMMRESTDHLKIEPFVIEMVELLSSDHVMVREWAKDIVGYDLSPALYPILFRELEKVMVNFSSTSSNCGPHCTLFVDQAVSVLKILLKKIADRPEGLFMVDFSSLVGLFTLYTSKLGDDEESLKLKIKLCMLIEVLMAKKDKVTLRQEFRLRNRLLEKVSEWTSDYLRKYVNSSKFQISSYSGDQEKLQQDLDLACLKTIVALLHQLPLQPLEATKELNTVADKSKIFYKYFTFFFKILHRCRVAETSIHVYSQICICNFDLVPLKKYTILALSNLLSANVDEGLKYSFPMGYHEDINTRTAFMEVLSNILNQGTEFENLAETVMTDRYEKLVDMIVHSDLNITVSLIDVCSSTEIDNMANALLACYASRNKTIDLLKLAIQKEVETTDNESNLFRRTSIATRLLSASTKEPGEDYLKYVLTPVFEKIPTNASYEIDPSKIASQDLEKNKKNVIMITDLFLTAICSSVAPSCFREISQMIVASVRKRFPGAKYTAVGSFLFLRFFCPAIVSPETSGLMKTPPSRELRRGLLMATKVIQSLANNVLFGAKETYMIILNDFLTSRIYLVACFLRDSSTSESAESSLGDYSMKDKDYWLLQSVLAEHMETLAKRLSSQQSKEWKSKLDKFANTLAHLGPVKETNDVFVTPNHLYVDFMRRNSERGMDSAELKRAFYDGGTTKFGRPVFYLIMRHVQVNSIDLELLIYHILHTLEMIGNRSYDLLIDFTLFSKDNNIPAQWLKQLVQLASKDLIDNIFSVYIFNPNSYLQIYLKKNPQIRPNHKLHKRTFFAVTLAELQEHIQSVDIRLPESTVGLETEPNAVFYPVYKIAQYRTNVSLAIKISAEYIQVMTVRKQDLIHRIHTALNDVYHISEIENIAIIENNPQLSDSANEFRFKTTRDSTTHIFSSPKREAIVNTIRQSQRLYESSRPTSLTERIIRPNDVPGRLLNMALLNLGSDDPELRLSSYKLLYSLTRTFNFDVDKELLDIKDLCLPANSTEFIVGISEKIAAKEPLLTIEFLNESMLGYKQSKQSVRYLILLYMLPWLSNLSLYCESSAENASKVKKTLRSMIDLTVEGEMTKLVQAKMWKAVSDVDGIMNLVIQTFVQVALEHGIGSHHAEVLADTLVSLTSVTLRLKLLSILRRALARTTIRPTRSLTDHASWPEIAILIRFILMTSFNSQGPLKRHVPEVLNLVALLAATGPTLVRASVHGILFNMIQMLCTRIPLPANHVQTLEFILADLSESKSRLLFGLHRTTANAFAVANDTLCDTEDPISLHSYEIIVHKLLEIMTLAAPNTDILHCWRARWMGLATSTAFQFNPAIQPRAFILLGHLGKEEIDDDVLYQILVALRGALAMLNESDPELIMSIMLCLKHMVTSMTHDSVYWLELFWVAVALVELNLPSIFATALELLEAVFFALDRHGIFGSEGAVDVLIEARTPFEQIAQVLDRACGVRFDQHFSFAIVGVVMKGMRYRDIKTTLYHCLVTFLEIEHRQNQSVLGYVAALLPMATDDIPRLLKLAGISIRIEGEKKYEGIFDKLEIADNTAALFVVSLLVTMIHVADSESERLFIYGVLSEAAVSIPDVFAIVYDSLLPRMNQIVGNSQTKALIECVKSILVTACSNPFFTSKEKRSQKHLLESYGLSALGDSTFGEATTNILGNAKLASEIIERIIS